MATDRDWAIEKLVPGGAGLARLKDGRIGFARGVFPGERVRVERAREHKSHVEAQRVSLQVAAPERVEPPCPYAETCGGCDWMALELDAQRRNKRALLVQALERTGGFRELPEVTLRHAGEPLGYRNRLRLQIGPRGELGFFSHHSHEVIEIEACLVAAPDLAKAFTRLRSIAHEHRTALTALSSIEVKVSEREPRRVIRVEARDQATLRRSGVMAFLHSLEQEFALSVAGRPDDIEQELSLPGGLTLRLPADAFTQVNWAVNELLVSEVVFGARQRGVESFCDLYGGSGNFTLPLLRAGLSGVLVEAHRGAVRAARRAAEAQDLEGEFRAADVGTALAELVRKRHKFDLALLDPPRTGARDVMDSIAALGAPHVAYVACDPVPLARDLRVLVARGYELTSLSVFDMFPQTHHFETLAWLRRARAGS